MAGTAAQAAARKRKRRRKKKKHKHPAAVAVPGAAAAPSAPSVPPKHRWIVSWDDSPNDGILHAIDDGADHDQPQAPGTIPPLFLPQPQSPPAPVTGAGPGVYSSPLPGGKLGRVNATRLLWRAGFGPRPGEAEALGELGVQQAVQSLTRPGAQTFSGPAPTADGVPIAPGVDYGHDHLWWLDRMVRANQPFTERIALILHDWFATSNEKVDDFNLMQGQTDLFRGAWGGSFLDLLRAITIDHAMLVWLDGIDNRKNAINENYGREVMELFTLGAETGAYTEADVRELARAFSGWKATWTEDGWIDFQYVASRHDGGSKTVFGRTGNWTVEDASMLCVENTHHADFFVKKLWSYFIPTPPSASTLSSLKSLYTGGGYGVRPVVEAILMHPDLYRGEPMVKPPVVYLAGLMRASGTYVDRDDWVWVSSDMGQQLFYPPNVSGWNDDRWLDTNTMRGRWQAVAEVMADDHPDPNDPYDQTETPDQALERALGHWAYPPLRNVHQAELANFSHHAWAGSGTAPSYYRPNRENALLSLVAVSPDLQMS